MRWIIEIEIDWNPPNTKSKSSTSAAMLANRKPSCKRRWPALGLHSQIPRNVSAFEKKTKKHKKWMNMTQSKRQQYFNQSSLKRNMKYYWMLMIAQGITCAYYLARHGEALIFAWHCQLCLNGQFQVECSCFTSSCLRIKSRSNLWMQRGRIRKHSLVCENMFTKTPHLAIPSYSL